MFHNFRCHCGTGIKGIFCGYYINYINAIKKSSETFHLKRPKRDEKRGNFFLKFPCVFDSETLFIYLFVTKLNTGFKFRNIFWWCKGWCRLENDAEFEMIQLLRVEINLKLWMISEFWVCNKAEDTRQIIFNTNQRKIKSSPNSFMNKDIKMLSYLPLWYS